MFWFMDLNQVEVKTTVSSLNIPCGHQVRWGCDRGSLYIKDHTYIHASRFVFLKSSFIFDIIMNCAVLKDASRVVSWYICSSDFLATITTEETIWMKSEEFSGNALFSTQKIRSDFASSCI